MPVRASPGATDLSGQWSTPTVCSVVPQGRYPLYILSRLLAGDSEAMSSVPELILLLVKVVQVLGARGWWQWSYAEDEARFMSHCTRRAKTKRRKAWIIGGWLDKRGGSVWGKYIRRCD